MNEDPYVYNLSSGQPGPRVLIIAGVHGDEWEPMVAAQEIIKQLSGRLIAGHLTVVPVANKDAYGQGSRCGTDNLDLARVCPGQKDGTVTQRVAYDLSQLITASDYIIDMHTGGQVQRIYPMAGYMLHSDKSVYEAQVMMARMANMPVIWGTDPLPEGRTLSVARDANKPAIYFEYGGGGAFNREVVDKYVAGIFNLLRKLGLIKGEVAEQPIESVFWVEDYSSNSGLFQSKMPSPAAGIFIPHFQPGDRVRKSQVFASLIEPVTGRVTEISVPFDGFVLAVRVPAGVQQGDALGAVLPIMQPGKVSIPAGGDLLNPHQ